MFHRKIFRLDSFADSGCFGLIARLAEEGKHVLLVGFHTGLVERIHAKYEARDAAGALEEVDELAEVVGIEFGHDDAEVGHAAIDVGQLRAEFGHLVHLVHAATFEEVEAVEVFLVVGEEHGVAGLCHRDDGLEDGALAVLNPLAHGVEVGGEVDGSGEDALASLAFAFAIELLPPFVHGVELGLIVGQDFDLLASVVEGIAEGSIACGEVFGERHFGSRGLLHVGSTLDEGFDVETSAGDGQQADGREYGEATAHVVGDDETLVAFLVGRDAGSTLLGIGHSNDNLAGHLEAALVLALLLEEAEGEGGFRGSARLGDVDDTEAAALEVFAEFGQIVFADIVARKQHNGILALVGEPFKLVAEGLDDGARTEITAADTRHDDGVAVGAQHLSGGLEVGEVFGCNGRGQVHPAQEIVAGTSAVFKRTIGGFYLGQKSLNGTSRQKLFGLATFERNSVH